MRAISKLIHRRFPLQSSALRWTSQQAAVAGPSLDARQDLYNEIGELTASFHDCQKQLASAQYTARLNPHSTRVRERADRTQQEMERIHDQFQMLLQREAHKSVTGAEIVFNGYRQIFQARTWHYNVLMDALLRHSPGQCDAMLTRLDKDGAEPDVEFFNLWLRALLKTRVNLVEVGRVLDLMQERGIAADRYTQSTVLEILAHNRQLDLVNETLDNMVRDGLAPTPAALARVLVLYGAVGAVDRGDAIRDSLLTASERTYSLQIWTSIMRYTLGRGQLEIAESIWDDMDKYETRPAPDVFDSYVAILLDKKQQKLSWAERRRRLKIVLGRAAKGFVRLSLRPVLPILPQIIEDYVHDQDVLRILFEAMAQSNFPAKVGVQDAFCDWFKKTGDLETLKVVMETMEKVGLSAQSLGHSIIRRSVQHKPTVCLQLARFMAGRGIPVYRESLASILFAASDRVDLELCDQVRQLIDELGMTPTEPLVNVHLSTAIQSNCPQRIDELFADARLLGYTLNPENAQFLLVALSSRGDLDACTYLFDMLKCGGDRVPTAVEYDSLIAAIIKKGDPLRALGLVREMGSHGISPSYPLLHEVINSFVQNGLLDDALHLVESLPKGRLTDFSTTCSNLITLLAQRGELERCERVCVLLEEAGGFPRISAMNSLMIAFGNVGMVEMAEKLFAMVLQRQPASKASHSAFNSFLAVLARNALFDRCGNLIAEMQSNNISIELFAFRQLVSSFAFRGRLDECESAYVHFSGAYDSKLDSVFSWLATPYARANALDRLRTFAKKVARNPDEQRLFLKCIDESQRRTKENAPVSKSERSSRL